MFLLQSSFLEQLIKLDRWLFIKINGGTANPVFDFVMPFLREPVIWTPFYVFLLVFAVANFKEKGWWWCLFFICLIAMTDLFSARVLKDNIERLRPCYDPDFYMYVRHVVSNCTAGRSFTSNHAANHVGMAFFMFFTLRRVIRRWAWVALAWGVLVAFAQIYVGLHYPFDIVGGAIIGFCFASLMAWFFHKKFGFITFDQQPTT